MIQEIKITPVFLKNYNARTRLVVNQGGSGSSKTYSITQLLLTCAVSENNSVIDFMRSSTPALARTVMVDWENILELSKVKSKHNKTSNTWTINRTNSIVSFYGLDDAQKIRGRRRDYGFIDEANESGYDAFRQIIMRTRKRLFLGYNPSEEFHWIYEKAIPRDDCTFIKSTYKDNPYLEPEVISEIERLQEEDPDYWRVYGLGERGASREIIYEHWEVSDIKFQPENIFYGLDFGYQVPTALIEISTREKMAHFREAIYQTHLTNSDLIQKMNELKIDKRRPIYADNAEPDRIEEIYKAGYNIKPANKSVKAGIDSVKSYKITIEKDSANIQKEFRSYKNKIDKNGIIIDEPVKFNDHACDAIRYGIHTEGMSTRGSEVKTSGW